MPEPYGIETAGSFGTGNTYIIVTVADTDFTAIGAVANRPGVVFEATGQGEGSGTARRLNTHLGRIGGKLLSQNLLRNGFDLEFDNNLLYLNVNDKKISVNTDISSYDLYTFGTQQTIELLVDDSIVADGLTFTKERTVSPATGDIIIDPSGSTVISTGLRTGDFLITNNQIRTEASNSNIELRPFIDEGVNSTVEMYSDLNINGSLEATGDITIDGSITFGDSNTDNVTFLSDINSNIVPNLNSQYRLGSPGTRWETIYTTNVNGDSLQIGFLGAGGVDIALREENLWYVSTNGSDENPGNHQLDTFKTIEKALSVAQPGDTVLIFPGVYEETTPLVVPQGVTVKGTNIRNVVIVPPSSASSNDIFHLNGETYVESLTIKDFYYDSINDTGYAFRFAPGASITSRSPYIQNITVITNTSGLVDDAGRGALIDGAAVDQNSNEASMLFHSCTFIVPNADAITMTNGVRVEWLNSFTYFANRGLYALQGTGRITQDGSTRRYGAEIRSIGSANVYGTYGAVADGADTLMYLINHNFAYIGVGTDTTNDNTLRIEENEVVKLNNGKIHFQSQDHRGKFKVGDNFFVDFDRGTTSINVTEADIAGSSRIIIDTQGQITVLDSSFIDTGSIAFSGNVISNASGELNIFSVTDQIAIDSTMNIAKNFSVTGDLSIDGEMFLLGNQYSDSIKFEAEISHNIIPAETLKFELGSNDKRWLRFPTTTVVIDDILINNNFIETSSSNADLEFRASGTGKIYTPDNVLIENNLSVGSDGGQLSDLNITGNLTYTGNTTQTGDVVKTGNVDITGDLSVSNDVQLEDIKIFGNVITTTESNSNLRLVSLESLERRRVFGVIRVPSNDLLVERNFTLGGITTTDDLLYPDAGFVTQEFGTDELRFFQNNLSSINSNVDIDLRATGDVFIGYNNVVLAENLTVEGSSDTQDITVTGSITHTGDKTQVGNVAQTGTYSITGVITTDSDANFENIRITNNKISTSVTASDLELRASGNGEIVIPTNDVLIENNLINSSSIFSPEIFNDFSVTSERFTNSQILIEDNYITTTENNLDLELKTTDVQGPNLLNNGDFTNFFASWAIDNVSPISGFGNGPDYQGAILGGSFAGSAEMYQEITNIPEGTYTLSFDVISTTSSEFRYEVNGGFGLASLYHLSPTDITGTIGTIITDFTVSYSVSTNAQILFFTLDGTTVIDNVSITTAGSIISIPSNNIQINTNLTVSKKTDLQNTAITGSLLHTGNRAQTGNYKQTGNIVISGAVDFDRRLEFENVSIDGNVITTLDSNSNLELRAAGSRSVILDGASARLLNDLYNSSVLYSQDILSSKPEYTTRVTSTDFNVTKLDFSSNEIKITAVDENLLISSTGIISVPTTDVIIENDLTVNSDTDIKNLEILGDLTHTGNRYTYGDYTHVGVLNIFGKITADRIVRSENIQLDDNVITTTRSNSDLELAANSLGTVTVLTNDVQLDQDLEVQGTTALRDLNATGDVVQTGNTTHTGNFSIAGEITNGNILIEDNFITTVESNADLIFRASGTGTITVDINDVIINNDLYQNRIIFSSDIDTQTATLTSNTFLTDNLEIVDNFIKANTGDLIVASTKDLSLTSSTEIDNDLTVSGESFLKDVNVTGSLTQTGTRFQIGNYQHLGIINIDGNIVGDRAVAFESILIDDNFITTTESNDDLILRAAGTGKIVIPTNDVVILNNLTVGAAIEAGQMLSQSTVDSDVLTTSDLTITDNQISTTLTNSDLEISSTNKISIPESDVQINNDLTVSGSSQTKSLVINGLLTQTGDRVQQGTLNHTGDYLITGKFTSNNDVIFEDIKFENNAIIADVDLELAASGTGQVKVSTDDVIITNDLSVTQTIYSTAISTPVSVTSGSFNTGDINITANEISTTVTNSDLVLRSTRNIVVQTTDTELDSNLTVEGLTSTRNVEIQGSVTHTGSKTFTGSYVQTGNTEISNNLTVTQNVIFEDIRIAANNITTTDSNSNLELAASGTGSVEFDVDILIQNNLRINGVTSLNDLTVSQVTSAERFNTADQEIYDNRIQTTRNDLPLKISALNGSVNAENVRILNNKIFTNTGKDLVFATAEYIDITGTNAAKLPAGTTAQKTRNTAGDLRFNSTESVFEGYYQSRIGFGGIYSDNKQTNVTAHPFDNVLRFKINGTQVGYIVDDLFSIHGIQIEDKLSFQGSTITNLEANGSINLVGNSVILENSLTVNSGNITNTLNTPLIFRNTGTGYVSFAQGLGFVIPVGDTAARTFAETGDIRYNTDLNDVEVYNGTEYQALSGDPENAEVDAQSMGEITNEWSLILG